MRQLTPDSQSSLLKQSPVRQVAVSLLTVQFVRPQTRPDQVGPTVRFLVAPGASSKPPDSGPSPPCVAIPGQRVSPQLFVTISGIGLSRFVSEGQMPLLAGFGIGLRSR